MFQLRKIVGIVILLICGPGAALVFAAAPIPVFVSIAPMRYFVEKVGGDFVSVELMVSPGANPHNYEPKPRQMVALTRAKIYFSVGTAFESVWLSRIASANPKMRIVPMEKGIKKIPMTADHHHGETDSNTRPHDPDQAQDTILDPHVWLSPPNVTIMARNIRDALATTDPDHHADYESNYEKFKAELDALDAALKQLLTGKDGREFMAFHPAWGYFAKQYGLKQIPVELEGKEPKPADLKYLIEYAKRRGIRTIFVQPQFSLRSAKVLADAIGGEIVAADPLAGDWAANLRRVSQKIGASLK